MMTACAAAYWATVVAKHSYRACLQIIHIEFWHMNNIRSSIRQNWAKVSMLLQFIKDLTLVFEDAQCFNSISEPSSEIFRALKLDKTRY